MVSLAFFKIVMWLKRDQQTCPQTALFGMVYPLK